MIRPAVTADIEIMSALMIEAIRATNFSDYSPEDLKLTYQNFTPAKVEEKMQVRDMFVYETAQRIVGTVSLEGDILHSLFVQPSLQGKGIGLQLVEHIENLAKRRGYDKMLLSSSITAKPFYVRLGYSAVEFEKRPFGSTWRMEKPLT